MTALDNDRLDDLVFARIAAWRGEKKLAPGAIARSIPVITSVDVKASFGRLIEAGAIDKDRRVLKGTIAQRFGVAANVTWRQVRDRVVPARALGIDDAVARERLKDRSRWAAAILARATKQWTGGPPPTLAAFGDAIAKKSRAKQAQRIGAIAHALQKKAPAGGTYEDQAAALAAQVAAAADSKLASLRAALVRRWLHGETFTPTHTVVVPPPPPADFATLVNTVAARATDGIFGTRKVFISALWRDPAFHQIPLDEFKRKLLSAHKAGTITLARADRIGGLDAAMLRESETPHLDSRYHFVERGGAS